MEHNQHVMRYMNMLHESICILSERTLLSCLFRWTIDKRVTGLETRDDVRSRRINELVQNL